MNSTRGVPNNSTEPDNKLQIRVSEECDDPQWDAFVASTPGGDHVQTSLWGQVKGTLGWKSIRATVMDHERIIAGAQLLYHSVAPLIRMGYVTKGPLGVADNLSLARLLFDNIYKLCRSRHVLYLIVQPPNNGQNLCTLLSGSGFRETKSNTTPTASVVIDLTLDETAILANMKRQNRQNIRRAERDGITIREGTRADLDSFYRNYQMTGRRQQFAVYPKEYFYRMWDILGRKGYAGLIVSEYGEQSVSGLLIVPYGDTVTAKFFGWSGQYSSSRPNEAVFWGALQWAKSHGYHYFDLQGIDPEGARAVINGEPLPASLLHSPTFMKLQFGGQVLLFPSAFEYIYHPIVRWSYYKVLPWLEKNSIFAYFHQRMRRSNAEA